MVSENPAEKANPNAKHRTAFDPTFIVFTLEVFYYAAQPNPPVA